MDDGLLAHFKLDGNATDSTGNGFDGINEGATAAVDRFGNPAAAMYFDGSSRILTGLDMNTSFVLADPVTFSAWFKTGQEVFRSFVIGGDLPGGGPAFTASPKQGLLEARLYGGDTAFSNQTVNDGLWHHIVWGTNGLDT